MQKIAVILKERYWQMFAAFYAGHCCVKQYNSLEEFLPECKQKVLEIYNEEIHLTLGYECSNMETKFPNGAPGK